MNNTNTGDGGMHKTKKNILEIMNKDSLCKEYKEDKKKEIKSLEGLFTRLTDGDFDDINVMLSRGEKLSTICRLYKIHDIDSNILIRYLRERGVVCDYKGNNIIVSTNTRLEQAKVRREEVTDKFTCDLDGLIDGDHTFGLSWYRIGNEKILLCLECSLKVGLSNDEPPKWFTNSRGCTKKSLTDYVCRHPVTYDRKVYEYKNHRGYSRRGEYISLKNNRPIFWGSLMELSQICYMEKDETIMDYCRGPKISYCDQNDRKTTYDIDFKVWYKDGRVVLVESKPMVLLSVGLDNFQGYSLIPKLDALEEYCEKNGCDYEYWTDFFFEYLLDEWNPYL